MRRRCFVLQVMAGLLLVSPLTMGPASGQDFEIRAPAPDQVRPEIVRPPLQKETTRPQQADDYPQGMRVPYDPAFFEPFVATWDSATSSGVIGLSGYTAPNPPVGSIQAANRVVDGYLAIGFTFTWGGPPRRPPRPAVP